MELPSLSPKKVERRWAALVPYNVGLNIEYVASAWIIVKTFAAKEPRICEIYWISLKE